MHARSARSSITQFQFIFISCVGPLRSIPSPQNMIGKCELCDALWTDASCVCPWPKPPTVPAARSCAHAMSAHLDNVVFVFDHEGNEMHVGFQGIVIEAVPNGGGLWGGA